jgi:SAM-dependent methyltransferase
MKKTECPLCRSATKLVYANLPGYQDGLFYDIRGCQSCGTSFSDPLEVDEQLYDLIYENIKLVPGYSRYFNYSNQILREPSPLNYLIEQEESYWAVGNYLRNKRSEAQDCRILEVGCGMGYFTYALVKDGFDARGIDISLRAVQGASERYGGFYECADLNEFVSRKAQRFDVVILNQLIEHIPDIRSFIENVLDVINPHGEIIITTPNKSLFPESNWETELPPVHLWWLSERSFEYIAREFNLSLAFVDFTEFYRNNYRQKTVLSKCHIFNSHGNFDFPMNDWKIRCKSLLKALNLESYYGFLRGKKRISGSKGPVIAAVLKKSQASVLVCEK